MIILILILASVCMLGVLIKSELRNYRLSHMSELQLIAELQAVGMEGVTLVALEYPDVCSGSNGCDPWFLVGGWRGLRHMYANSSLLIALAAQAQAWDYHSAALTFERLNDSLLELRRAVVLSLCGRVLVGGTQLGVSHLHEAAKSYYEMTERLLNLYQHSPSRLYTRLDSAIWPNLKPVFWPV